MRRRAMIAFLLCLQMQGTSGERPNNAKNRLLTRAPQKRVRSAMPTEFVVARRTYFDCGPPFEYYEVLAVRPTDAGSVVERVLLSPIVDKCTHPATIKSDKVSLSQSIPELLEHQNPCVFPEKDLRRERKRCKHCLTFSGAEAAMEVECGGEVRRIRSDILDRDLFDARAAAPQYTSWTMRLLNRLDNALGSTVMDAPAFSLEAGRNDSRAEVPSSNGSGLAYKIKRGDFDSLFGGGSFRASEIVRDALLPPPAPPTVELIESLPFKPVQFVAPKYPPLANAARISGKVTVSVALDESGKVAASRIVAGHPLLKAAVMEGAKSWIFSREAAGREIEVTIGFKLNCVSNRN